MVYTAGGLYATYHLLREPETTIDYIKQPTRGPFFVAHLGFPGVSQPSSKPGGFCWVTPRGLQIKGHTVNGRHPAITTWDGVLKPVEPVVLTSSTLDG